MAFGKTLKYGSVTLDFVVECAKMLGVDLQKKENFRQIMFLIGFEVSVLNEETGLYVPCKIDQMNNVNVRCVGAPYKCRPTTVFSGRVRDVRDFPNASIYDKVDILDVGDSVGKTMVNSLPYDIPSVEKVNTRKYTKQENRSDVVILDLPEIDDIGQIFNLGEGV